jgi:phosphohistidine phosphatase
MPAPREPQADNAPHHTRSAPPMSSFRLAIKGGNDEKRPMFSLTLFRHAKTEAVAPGSQDFDRLLTDRGRRDAARVGAMLAHRHYDLALVSAASRTRETWAIVRAAFTIPPEAQIDRDLYLCGARRLVRRLGELPDTVSDVLVVAHNPDMQEIALWLTGDEESRPVREMRNKFPTAAVAIFNLDIATWADLGPKQAKLERFTVPGDLEE